MANLMIVLSVALTVALMTVVARRLGIASYMVLLVGGIAWSFTPGVPAIELSPDLVLTLLLPPLLYSSGVGMSWRGFRSNMRPILLLAVGCVLFTAVGVAAVAHYALGLSWPLGFVLGAIVSPPDAVAPMAILRQVGLPRRLLTVLEGESLVNDATALVILSFALGTVGAGVFSPAKAAAAFTAIVAGELAWGLAVGWCLLRLRHLVHEPRAEVVLALATPFLAFLPPHALGGSGVIACVVTGLWVSWNGRRMIRPDTRLQGYFIWGLTTWLIEGSVFLLTGLQARAVLSGVADRDWVSLCNAGVLISLAVILVRFVWVFPATYLPRLFPGIGRHDPAPNWQLPFMVGFTGLRGVVSLAAALSIPLTVADQAFPERGLLLFLTFCVIVATLVLQGAALPAVARALGLGRAGAVEAQANKHDERAARLVASDAALAELARAAEEGSPPGIVEALRRAQTDRRNHLARTADESTAEDPVSDATGLHLRMLTAERDAVDRAYDANQITDEARRRIEREFDLEEARTRDAASSAGAIPEPA